MAGNERPNSTVIEKSEEMAEVVGEMQGRESDYRRSTQTSIKKQMLDDDGKTVVRIALGNGACKALCAQRRS